MRISTHYRGALSACRPLALLTIITLAPALAKAQQLSSMFGNGAGGISQVAAVQVAQDQFVTAVINSTGNLEVIGWYANLSTKQLVRQGSSISWPVATWYANQWPAIAISSPYALNVGISGVFTTAMLNSQGYLDMIQWNLQPNGAISKLGEMIYDGGATAVSIASVYSAQNGDQQVVAAVRTASGNLQVSLWYFDPVKGFGYSGTAYAGGINSVGIACLQTSIQMLLPRLRTATATWR